MRLKHLFLLIILALALTVVSSCAAETEETGESETAVTETAAETEIPPPDIPAADFDGYIFTMLTNSKYNGNFRLDMEDDGDTLNAASYRRNLALSEKYNIDFTVVEDDGYAGLLKQSVMASDGAYDFILPHATVNVASMVTDGLLYNWNNIEYADFTKPWWNASMTENLAIGNNLFYVSGDIVLAWQGMIAIIFNKTYLNDFNIDIDMYQTFYDGKWTYDLMNSITKGIASDLNGDGKMDADDRYGLLASQGSPYADMFAMGQRITTRDEDGLPVLSLNTEHMLDVVQKYYDTVFSPDTFLNGFASTTYATGNYRTMILEGRSFLSELDIGSLHVYLREIEFDFGLISLPKFNEARENYQVFCGAGLIGIPLIVNDIKLVGMIAEDMSYYSYKYLRPAFFNIVLQNKAVRDEDSYKVLQIMHENKTFDFGFNFDSTALAFSILGNVVINKKSTDFASYYQTVEAQITTALDKVCDAFR
jgi:hypothetical protein